MKFNIRHGFQRSLQSLFAATALLAASLTADGAAYIKFDGIDGEVAESGHKEWIDVLSFGNGMSRETTSDPATGVPALKFESFKVEKPTDRSSPKIMEAVCLGKVFPSVVIESVEVGADGRETYYRYELKNVLVTSYQVSGSGGTVPTEQLSLNFEEIKVIHVDRDGSRGGNVEFEWKVEEGES